MNCVHNASAGRSTRAQSHTVGVILLTAVVVLLIGVFGVVYLGGITDRATGNGPLVDADVNATADRIVVVHAGGDRLDVDELDVLLRVDGAEQRFVVDEQNFSDDGDGDGQFDPTERFVREHDLGPGQMEVLLIHTPSNAILQQTYLDARSGDGLSGGTPATASFTHGPSDPAPGDAVTFDASGSTGAGGVVDYTWVFGDGDTGSGETTTHTFASAGDYDVTLTVVDSQGATDETTRTVTVESTSLPTIESTTFTDGDDDLVTAGDQVTVTTTVSDDDGDIDAVTADASAFDAGEVTLTDGDGDGTYEADFAVGSSALDGEQTVTVEATDDAGNNVSTVTEDAVTVDTTPPEFQTFTVSDMSSSVFLGYEESFDIEWTVTDERLVDTAVYVNRSGAVQQTYSGSTGDESYQNRRWFSGSGRDHTVTIVAEDEAGNRACLTVTDDADGTDPSDAEFASC